MTAIMTKAGGFPHGTRASYVNEHCRCDACTAANRVYAREYNRRVRSDPKHPNSLISALETRDHIEWLSRHGIGKRRLHELAGVSLTTIEGVRRGEQHKVRRGTRDAICAITIDERADGSPVDARHAQAIVERLLGRGWTRCKIAARLGSKAKAPSLQVCKREKVLKKTLRRLEVLEQLAARGLVAP